jgi:serine/threonine protein phosphatase PrpC
MVAAVTRNSHPAIPDPHPSWESSPFTLKKPVTTAQTAIQTPFDGRQNPRYATGLMPTGHPNIAGLTSRGLNLGRYDGKNQDRCIYGTCHITSAKEAKRALLTGFGDADRATSHFYDGGSTASVVTITPDGKLTAAQAGDSPIILVLRNKTTGEVVSHNLTVDQRPVEPAERARIEAAGGTIDEEGRLVGADSTLAVSRTLGDHAFSAVSAEPSTLTYDISKILKNPNTQVFVMVCSDGLTDHATHEELSSKFKEKGTPAQIAERLKTLAFERADEAGVEESDNISLVLALLDPKAKGTTYLGVTDGHGDQGGAVAELARRNIDRALHRHQQAEMPRHAAKPGSPRTAARPAELK